MWDSDAILELYQGIQFVLLILIYADITQSYPLRTVIESIHYKPYIIAGHFIGPVPPGFAQAMGAKVLDAYSFGGFPQYSVTLNSAYMSTFFA